ncbi:MAG: hypothetical protein H6560_00255 [Lewinellaceae bacterium]|nr:hypothetical protein [Lewinellaceae bacterium]
MRALLFTIRIPIRQEAPLQKEGSPMPSFPEAEILVAPPAEPGSPAESAVAGVEAELAELPSLLVIEDNPDVAAYLFACLEGRYQLEHAKDGSRA